MMNRSKNHKHYSVFVKREYLFGKCWIRQKKVSQDFHMRWHLLIGYLTSIYFVFHQGQRVKWLMIKALHARDLFGMKKFASNSGPLFVMT
jgi:hypothetical protein